MILFVHTSNDGQRRYVNTTTSQPAADTVVVAVAVAVAATASTVVTSVNGDSDCYYNCSAADGGILGRNKNKNCDEPRQFLSDA